MKNQKLEIEKLSKTISNQMQQKETIIIADRIFNSGSYGRFDEINLNVCLWIPKLETDSFNIQNRLTGETEQSNFFEMLFYALEHELLHKTLYEIFDFETTFKFDCIAVLNEFPLTTQRKLIADYYK